MVKKRYTELERELYENLAEIYSTHKEMMITVWGNLSNLYKKDDKWLDEFTEKLFKISDILKEAKIPKKFLILNGLEDKNG